MIEEVFLELIEDDEQMPAQGARAIPQKLVERQREIDADFTARARHADRMTHLALEHEREIHLLPVAKDDDGDARLALQFGQDTSEQH